MYATNLSAAVSCVCILHSRVQARVQAQAHAHARAPTPVHTCKMSRLERRHNGIALADLAARGVDQVGAGFHLADQLLVKEFLGARVQRAVDGDHIALPACAPMTKVNAGDAGDQVDYDEFS